MKANGGKKSVKKTTKEKSKLEEWFINTFAIVLLGGGMVFIVYMSTEREGQQSNETDQYLASLPPKSDTIIHRKVCMVDDFYQGDYPTLPVVLSANTYYGCDAKAIHELSKEVSSRYAIDPVTNQKVDKARAVIGLHPKRDGKVLYFESKASFEKFLNQ